MLEVKFRSNPTYASKIENLSPPAHEGGRGVWVCQRGLVVCGANPEVTLDGADVVAIFPDLVATTAAAPAHTFGIVSGFNVDGGVAGALQCLLPPAV